MSNKANENGEGKSTSYGRIKGHGRKYGDDGTKVVKDSISSLLDSYFILTENKSRPIDMSFRP